jgi:hypothetical protein
MEKKQILSSPINFKYIYNLEATTNHLQMKLRTLSIRFLLLFVIQLHNGFFIR